jgi:hypothetical protein
MTQWPLLRYREHATAQEQHESFDEPDDVRRFEGHTDSTKDVTMKTDGTKKKSAGKAPRASQPSKGAARQDKPVITDLETTLPDPFDIVDEPPMSLAPRPRKLAWSYSVLREIDSSGMDDLFVEAGTKIAIEGILERLGYLYVIQIGEDKSIEVLFPSTGGPRRARPGVHVRLPSGTGWIVTTKRGKLRTITSSRPLSEADLAAFA